MALSGSFNTNKYSTSSHGTIGLNLSWTATQNIVNNTSTIKWTLKSNGSMSSSYYVQGGPITVTINGTKVLNYTGRTSIHGGGGYKKTGSITVRHAEDGTKKVSMSVKAALYSASVNCTGSQTFTLNTINRYALISTAENFDDEGNPKITFTNPAGTEMTRNLKARIKWMNGSTEEATDFEDIPVEDWSGGELTFTLLTTDRNRMRAAAPASNTLAVTYDLQSTMNGSDYHHTKAATMAIINAEPTAGEVTYYDADNVTGDDQIIVQRQSTLVIHTASSTPKKGAAIASYSLNFNGEDYTPDGNGDVTITAPDFYGTLPATVTTTDTRGNTATASVDVPITAWREPEAEITLERVKGFEITTKLTVSASISPVYGSTLSISERHKEKEGSTWIGPNPVTNNDTVTLLLDNTKEWEFEITVSDAFDSTIYTPTVGKGVPIAFIDIDKNSVGVNGFPDAAAQIYVDGTIKATGKITAPSMSVQDISSLYTLAKTSGNWTLKKIDAIRSGSVVHMRLAFSGNGNSVSAGSNGYVGTLSGGPLPALSIKLIAYYNNCPIMMNIEPDGSVTARVTATSVTVTSSGTLALTGTFITND